MSGTQNGTGELQKSLAAGSGKWEISLHSRWYPRTWGLNLKWKAVTCKLSHQFPMSLGWSEFKPPSQPAASDIDAEIDRICIIVKILDGDGEIWRVIDVVSIEKA